MHYPMAKAGGGEKDRGKERLSGLSRECTPVERLGAVWSVGILSNPIQFVKKET